MVNSEAHFLNKIFNLNTSVEVSAAARRTKILTGKNVPQKVEARIQNYLDRLQFILNNEDGQKRDRAHSLLRSMIYDKYIVKPDEIVDYRLRTEQRIARQQGHGTIEITDYVRNRTRTEISSEIKETIGNQMKSLEAWIDYLFSADVTYPSWLKYFIFRNILSLASFDNQKSEFPKRSKSTTDWSTLREFPELNREALAYVVDDVAKKIEGVTQKEIISKLIRELNFGKLYSEAFEKAKPGSVERLSVTDGRWVKFDQGSNAQSLVDSLQGFGTGWCTAGLSTAESQLKRGDVFVYYSLDRQGKFSVPRVAIRMEGDRIAEVRGIAENQNLDPYVGSIVQEKLAEFPDGKSYAKKTSDMRMLTTIENKINSGRAISKEELIFLYEINATIQGFGYKRDPRVAELQSRRDLKEDVPTVFDCTADEIAWDRNEVCDSTKAYIGPLFPGIFREFSDIEHVYSSFPDGRVFSDEMVIGNNNRKGLLKLMKMQKNYIESTAKQMILSSDFAPRTDRLSGLKKVFRGERLQTSEVINLVRIKVSDLGFERSPTIDQIFAKADELGLELCPAEVGPEYRLHYTDQPYSDLLFIGMKPIITSTGDPYVFVLSANVEPWFKSYRTTLNIKFPLDYSFLFRLPRSQK